MRYLACSHFAFFFFATFASASLGDVLTDPEHNARVLAVKEFHEYCQQYSRQVVRENRIYVKSLRVHYPSQKAQAMVVSIALKQAQLSKKYLEEDAEADAVTTKEQADCMNRKAEKDRDPQTNKRPDPEEYRWDCYAESGYNALCREFGKWFEKEVTSKTVKWSRDSAKKISTWVAKRKVERDTSNTWHKLVKKGRIGGELGRATEGAKDFLKRISPFTALAVEADYDSDLDKKLSRLSLTNQEVQFLSDINKEHEGLVTSLVVLWGIAEIASTPKTPQELAETLAKESVVAQIPNDWSELFTKGLKKLSIKPVYDQVVLFIHGKHPNYKRYRPKGDNYYFFKNLGTALEYKLSTM